MPVELNITESVTELDTTIVTVTLESASEPGPAGPGVPTGGTAGQVLTKDSGTDYDTSWQDATGGGGGGVTDADYLVGTAHAGLSAEIVVGTSPGGELGGTWASPTVDATHSGSSHASVQAAAEATAAAALTAHEADTTGVHGIADTSALALTANVPSNATFNDHSARHENGGADEISIAGLDGTSTELAAHLADTSDAHDASAISFTPTGNLAATDAQAAIAEAATDAASALSTHESDTTSVHGITDTSTLYRAGGTDVALADGGTGASLADPNADRIMFWDDSAGNVDWLTAGTGLTITGTTISAAGSSFDPDQHMPWMVEWPGLDPFGANFVAKTGWATTHTASDGSVQLSIGSTSQGGGMQYGGTAQNDSVEWDIVLAAGTWNLQFECVKFTDCGIVTVTIDGSSVGTIDTYAGGASYNQIVGITGITIASTGKKRIKFAMLTKNASSSGYVFRGQTRLPIRMRRTA